MRGRGRGGAGRAEEAGDRADPRCLADGLALLPNFTFTARLLYGLPGVFTMSPDLLVPQQDFFALLPDF